MNCPYCHEDVNESQARCYKCGKSLATRSIPSKPELPNQESSPYIRTQEQERRTHFIANAVIFIMCGLFGALVIGVFALRFAGAPEDKHKNVDIQIITFDVVDADAIFSKMYGTNNKLIIKFSVANKSDKVIKRLDAKIYAKSSQLQIWSSGGGDNVFNLVSPIHPLRGNDAVTVDVPFPVQYSPRGLVKVTWDTEIVLVE